MLQVNLVFQFTTLAALLHYDYIALRGRLTYRVLLNFCRYIRRTNCIQIGSINLFGRRCIEDDDNNIDTTAIHMTEPALQAWSGGQLGKGVLKYDNYR
jgi:hypothetical protein